MQLNCLPQSLKTLTMSIIQINFINIDFKGSRAAWVGLHQVCSVHTHTICAE